MPISQQHSAKPTDLDRSLPASPTFIHHCLLHYQFTTKTSALAVFHFYTFMARWYILLQVFFPSLNPCKNYSKWFRSGRAVIRSKANYEMNFTHHSVTGTINKHQHHKPLNMLQWGYTMARRCHLTSFTTHSIVSSTNTSFGISSAVMMDNAAEAASSPGITWLSSKVISCCISSSDSSHSLQQSNNNHYF